MVREMINRTVSCEMNHLSDNFSRIFQQFLWLQDQSSGYKATWARVRIIAARYYISVPGHYTQPRPLENCSKYNQ